MISMFNAQPALHGCHGSNIDRCSCGCIVAHAGGCYGDVDGNVRAQGLWPVQDAECRGDYYRLAKKSSSNKHVMYSEIGSVNS